MSEPHQDDQQLERDLARIYRSGEQEEPSEALDRRILAAAQRTVPRRRRRWAATGLATAAVMVLAVGILLRPMLDTPDRGAESRSLRDVVGEPPAAPSGAQRFPEQSTAPVEEVIVTARFHRAAAPEPLADAADAAKAGSGQAAGADEAAASYAAPGCAEPYPLPPGATIRSVPGGIEVTAGDAAFTLRCREGAWQRQPAARDR